MGRPIHLFHTMHQIKAKGDFFENMMHTLRLYLTGMVVLGGETNLPFDLSLDKSNLGTT